MNEKKIVIELQKLIIVIIYLSIIFFNGGVNKLLDIYVLNSYYDIIFIFFYLIVPIICSYVLLEYFKNHTIQLKIHPYSILIGAFSFLFILTKHLKNLNLFGDEYYYTFRCFKIINAIISATKIDELSFLANFSYSIFLRILMVITWAGSFLFFYYIFKYQTKIKDNKLFLISLFLLKLFILLYLPNSDLHPPLNYLFPSIFMTIFGLSTISIKSSIIFVNVLFIIYLYNRVRLSKLSIAFIAIFIFSTPVIGDFTIYYDQAIYSFFCFTIVIIEIFYKKIKPSYLVLIISIFSLFRYASIAAYPAAFIYSYAYYNLPALNWRIKILKVVQSLTPILLSIPVISLPIILGTPTTDAIHQTNLNLADYFKFSGSVSENVFTHFNLTILIPITSFFFFVYLKQTKILGYIFVVYISYHILFTASNTIVEPVKYLLEQIGFVYVFCYVFLIERFFNLKKINQNSKILVLAFLICTFSIYDFYRLKIYPDNDDYHEAYGFFFRNNNQDYFINYIDSYNLYDKSLIISLDYGPMIFSLYNGTIVDYKKYYNSWYQYTSLKNKKKIGWRTLEPSIIQEMKNIKYLFITDYLYEHNKENISTLINNYGWEIIKSIEKTNYFSDFYILRKII